MAYSLGGLIAAVDYNNFVGASTSTTSGQLNAVWATGNGAYGYGQTAISQSASTAGIVTATQWATLINALNNVRTHQTGAGSGISAVTAGQQINYLSTLSTQITNAYTNAASYASQGATVTGTNYTTAISGTTGISSYTDRFVSFASADSARYFFNAGGQLNLVLSTSSSNGTGSSSSFDRLITGLGGVNIKNTANGGRTGTGITLNTNNTAFGYRNLVYATNTNIIQVTDTTAAYTADTAYIGLYTNDATTTNGSVGAQMNFRITYSIADHTWDDTLGITLNSRVDIVYPESTYLTNSWGTPTIS
jgi:hypothetical protein